MYDEDERDFDDDLEFTCHCGETFRLLGQKFRHMRTCEAVTTRVDLMSQVDAEQEQENNKGDENE